MFPLQYVFAGEFFVEYFVELIVSKFQFLNREIARSVLALTNIEIFKSTSQQNYTYCTIKKTNYLSLSHVIYLSLKN